MIKKTLAGIVFAIMLTGCMEDPVKEISIPVPVTEPVEISGLDVTLSGSIVQNNDKTLKTGFSIMIYPVAPQLFLPQIIYSDSTSNDGFFATIQQDRMLQNRTYYVRSCVEFNDQKIYGNEVSFTADQNIVTSVDSVAPNSGKANDVIEIHGQNFIPGFTKVKLGRLYSTDNVYVLTLVSVSKTKIVAKVPETPFDYGTKYLNVITSLYCGDEGLVTKFFSTHP